MDTIFTDAVERGRAQVTAIKLKRLIERVTKAMDALAVVQLPIGIASEIEPIECEIEAALQEARDGR